MVASMNKAPIQLKPLPEPRLEILNLIDILITLVAFFMLTSTFVVEQSHQNIGVNLPQARQAGKSDQAPAKLIVELDKNHQLFFKGQPVKRSALKELFQGQSPDEVLTVRADKDCRYSWVVEVLDLAAGCKLNKVALEVSK
jgi:biopolymer transport protein ExbD